MFSNARNISITGGEFHVGANRSTEHWREALKLLRDNIAPGAFHNSAERYDPPKCHPQTRRAVIKKIMDWIQDTERVSRFMWLYGPAGAGKSAIAQTIAELCYQLKLLAASFFFSRSAAGRNDKTRLIATIAYQLTRSIPELRVYIASALEDDPLLFSYSLEDQIQALLVDPLNQLSRREYYGETMQSLPKLIIIDGLDECTDGASQQEILNTLNMAVECVDFPIIFLIASRPEPDIRNAFIEISSSTYSIALDDTYHPDADIRVFLQSRFDEIRKRHPSRAQIPSAWPSEEHIQKLVYKASGQFIFASTVAKFVESRNHRPMDRLDIVLGLSSPSDETPFAELDTLYHHILSSVFDITRVLEILSFLILLPPFEFRRSPSFIEDLLFYKYGEVYTIMADMHSVVHVPPSEGEEGELHLLHASLADYLLDRQRSGQFFIDPGKMFANFTRYFMRHMKPLLSHYKHLNTSQQVSHRALIKYCLLSSATDELLNDLDDFDIESFLRVSSQLPYFTERELPRLPGFLTWIQDHTPTDLERKIREKLWRFIRQGEPMWMEVMGYPNYKWFK